MMPFDFILAAAGFLAATACGYLVYKFRKVSDDLDHHFLTLPVDLQQEPLRYQVEYARQRHPSTRRQRRCPDCAHTYEGSPLDHVHQDPS